jgi:D-alanyl-lipoteichoic acid acyltransferase DltB (MBOAT superfamily)
MAGTYAILDCSVNFIWSILVLIIEDNEKVKDILRILGISFTITSLSYKGKLKIVVEGN